MGCPAQTLSPVDTSSAQKCLCRRHFSHFGLKLAKCVVRIKCLILLQTSLGRVPGHNHVNWLAVAGFSVSWEVCWNPAPDDSLLSFQAFCSGLQKCLFFSVINPILDLNYCRILSKELGALVLILSKKL